MKKWWMTSLKKWKILRFQKINYILIAKKTKFFYKIFIALISHFENKKAKFLLGKLKIIL